MGGRAVIDKFDGDYAFLSNFYPCWIAYENVVYPTSEHAFQAAKTLDKEQRLHIARLDTPGKAKRAGKHVTLRDNWNQIRVQVMREILQLKFSDAELQQQLLATGDAMLVEGNTWNDRFWGVCKGTGENWLGKLLMEVRELYRA